MSPLASVTSLEIGERYRACSPTLFLVSFRQFRPRDCRKVSELPLRRVAGVYHKTSSQPSSVADLWPAEVRPRANHLNFLKKIIGNTALNLQNVAIYTKKSLEPSLCNSFRAVFTDFHAFSSSFL